MTAPWKDEWISPDGSVRLLLGDCEPILATMPPVDLLLTDPPYGIGVDGQRISTSSHGGRKPYDFLGWDGSPPNENTIQLLLSAGRDAIIWGANYFPASLRPSMGWLVWDKGQEICSSDCELAFTTFDKALRRVVINRVELQKDGAVHPTQKPVKLMTFCLKFAGDEYQSVIDPYMGSGSTGVAAIRLGKSFLGIEREPRYFAIARKRIEAELSRFPLFAVQERETQTELFNDGR